VLPLTVGIRDGAVHLVSTLGSAVTSARAELSSIITSALPAATVKTRVRRVQVESAEDVTFDQQLARACAADKVSRTQALVNRTQALVNRTQALVNRTQALVNRTQELVNRTQVSFCGATPRGGGRVMACLQEHRHDDKLSAECATLTRTVALPLPNLCVHLTRASVACSFLYAV
jgi:hypothetical protein